MGVEESMELYVVLVGLLGRCIYLGQQSYDQSPNHHTLKYSSLHPNIMSVNVLINHNSIASKTRCSYNEAYIYK